MPTARRRQCHQLAGALIVSLHEGFAEGLFYKELMALPFLVATNIAKVDVRNQPGSYLQRFRVASNEAAPMIAITGVGEKSYCDTPLSAKARARKVLVQSPALAVQLIETPELRGRLHRRQAVRHLVKQQKNIHLMKPNPFPHNLWSNHFILHLDRNRCVQVL